MLQKKSFLGCFFNGMPQGQEIIYTLGINKVKLETNKTVAVVLILL